MGVHSRGVCTGALTPTFTTRPAALRRALSHLCMKRDMALSSPFSWFCFAGKVVISQRGSASPDPGPDTAFLKTVLLGTASAICLHVVCATFVPSSCDRAGMALQARNSDHLLPVNTHSPNLVCCFCDEILCREQTGGSQWLRVHFHFHC